jgi:Flp pilus assembly protein CpaB
MERPFRRVRLLSLILLSAVVASGARAAAIEKKDRFQVAALALPGGRKHGTYFFCQLPLL